MSRANRSGGRGHRMNEGYFIGGPESNLKIVSGVSPWFTPGMLNCTFGLATINSVMLTGVTRNTGVTPMSVVATPSGGFAWKSGVTEVDIYCYDGLGSLATVATSVAYIAIGT